MPNDYVTNIKNKFVSIVSFQFSDTYYEFILLICLIYNSLRN
jgi:hypothetical protein